MKRGGKGGKSAVKEVEVVELDSLGEELSPEDLPEEGSEAAYSPGDE